MILLEKGYNVTAWAYCDSLESVREVKPDLVLIDLWFPEIGGAELCKQMKADPDMKSIPVIVVSATNELDKTAKRIHADDFIRKPFNVREVVDKVANMLSS